MKRWSVAASAVFGLLGGLVSLAVAPGLPESIPIHWDASGTPDGFVSKVLGLSLIPVLTFLFPAVLTLAARRESDLTRSLFEWVIVGTSAFFFALHLLIVHAALTPGFGLSSSGLFALIGGLNLLIAFLLPKTEPNRVMGYRMKATFNDPVLWKLVHRFAGRALGMASVVVILSSVFLHGTALFGVAMTLLMAGALLPFVYAWMLASARTR